MKNEKMKHVLEIDYLRGFAILAVLSIHTSANFTRISTVNSLLILNVIIDVFSHFAVPLFIFISGFVLSLKYKNPFSKKLFYKKRLKSTFPQYVIFSMFYIIAHQIGSLIIKGSVKLPTLNDVVFKLLTASSSYHLWYFALLFQLYIIYPYIIKIYEYFDRSNRTEFILWISFIVQEIWIILVILIKNNLTFQYSSLINRLFISHVFYFVLGIYVCQNFNRIKERNLKINKWMPIIILIITLFISAFWIKGIVKYGNYYDIPPHYMTIPALIQPIYYSLIFSVILKMSSHISKIKNRTSTLIYTLGKYSFGIYLIHVIYMEIIGNIIFPRLNLDYNYWIFYPLLFIFSIILSYYSVYLISYLPNSKMIVGIKKEE